MNTVWVLVLVTLAACGDPLIEKIGPAFPEKFDCVNALVEYTRLKGPPSPGSYYDCRQVK